jgi:hypothetical protein
MSRLRVEDHFARILQALFQLHIAQRRDRMELDPRPLMLKEVELVCDSVERDVSAQSVTSRPQSPIPRPRPQTVTLLEPSNHLKTGGSRSNIQNRRHSKPRGFRDFTAGLVYIPQDLN